MDVERAKEVVKTIDPEEKYEGGLSSGSLTTSLKSRYAVGHPVDTTW